VSLVGRGAGPLIASSLMLTDYYPSSLFFALFAVCLAVFILVAASWKQLASRAWRPLLREEDTREQINDSVSMPHLSDPDFSESSRFYQQQQQQHQQHQQSHSV